jgi:hypothetical protein
MVLEGFLTMLVGLPVNREDFWEIAPVVGYELCGFRVIYMSILTILTVLCVGEMLQTGIVERCKRHAGSVGRHGGRISGVVRWTRWVGV